MTATGTDLFSGAGGSTTGALRIPGISVRIAANHDQLVTDIHALNHQATDHAVVDLHQERPSFFPKTDWLWASPECTKWSQANGEGAPAIEVGLFEDPLSNDAMTRSRLLMFDVLRFIEHHRYRLVFIENVVDIATQKKYATAWQVWRQELRALGYAWRVISLNAMHAQTFGMPAPQSRDRIYIVAWPEKEKAPDLESIVRPKAYCPRCDVMAEAVQSWKPKREVGRYRQAYTFNCKSCNRPVEPGWLPALEAIDWTIVGTRIADRETPLADKTLDRIAAGIARYWGPLVIEGSGNTYDAADPKHPQHGDPDAYYRAWSAVEPLRALHTTNSKALAVPVEGRDGKDALPIDWPMRTQTTRAETALAFIAEMYGTSTARSVREPAGTFTAGGNHHALVVPSGGTWNDEARSAAEPLRTLTSSEAYAFVMTQQHANRARDVGEAMPTLTTATGGGHALVQRMNGGGAEMTTPLWEELRTLTTGGNVALLQQPERRPISPRDLAAARELVPEVLFRMFEPHEVAAGMAFPDDYKWQPPDRNKPVSKRALVKAAGNAVCPPCARDVVGVATADVFGTVTERAA